MKTPVLCVLALSFGLLAGGAALSDEQKPPTASSKLNSSSKITTGVSLPDNRQLYKPGSSMKIPKNSPPKVLALPMRSAEIPTYDPINADLEAFKRAVAADHEAETARNAKAFECWERDYTQADQAAAGCSATETVSRCYEKLAVACATPSLVRSRNASSALEGAHSKLKNTLVSYMQRLRR